jgi:large subunit ribosomal protein L10
VDRKQKRELVTSLNKVFNEAALVVVTRQSGMTVAESTDLRVKMRAAGAQYKVAKNRLVKLALKETQHESLSKYFEGVTAIAYSEDPIAAAKVIAGFSKGNKKVEIVAGGLNGVEMDMAGIKALAELPSLDELRSKMLGLFMAAPTKVATVLQAPASQLTRVIKAYSEKDN